MKASGRTPLVDEDERKKVLRFDSRYLQSAMYKHAPFDLALSYTRAMMGFLLFQPVPRDVLIVGLGGGSLSKYCHRYLAEASITTVEIDAAVIALRAEFEIPPEGDRFRIVHADAAEYLAQSAERVFDVIVLDGYDREGLPEPLCTPDFYDRCLIALRGQGVVVANFLENDRRHGLYLSRLRNAFDDRIVTVLSDRGTNRIVFGVNSDAWPTGAALRERARQFEGGSNINLRALASRVLRAYAAERPKA